MVRRNDRSICAPRQIDFCCDDLKVAIEYCGLYWHCDVHDRITPQYHAQKYRQCKEQGWRLITIFEDEWIHSPQIVTDKLRHILGNPSTYTAARKLKVVSTVALQQANQFMKQHHIQGPSTGWSLGLADTDGDLKCVATFRRKGYNTWYLSRYASSVRIAGGLGKIMAHFKRHHPDATQVYTFADLRWSEGAIYERCGFVCDSVLPPDYAYVDPDSKHRIHKFNYRHKFLKKRLKQYDPTKSERENTRLSGVYRIWDCGKKRYVLNLKD